jgi:hypothetical protein
MSTFDFERVHEVMEKIGWRYSQRDGMRVPTIKELKKDAEERLRGICERGSHVSESGGFCAIRRGSFLRLSFEVAWAFNEDVLEKEQERRNAN